MIEERGPTRWLSAPPTELPRSYRSHVMAYRKQGWSAAERERIWREIEHSQRATVFESRWRVPRFALRLALLTAAVMAQPDTRPRTEPSALDTALPIGAPEGPAQSAELEQSPPDHAVITSTPAPLTAASWPRVTAERTSALPAPSTRSNRAAAPEPSMQPQPRRSAANTGRQQRELERLMQTLPTQQSELELLMRARRVLRTAPESALALTDQHRHDFPRSTFGEEREALAIAALQRLGRSDQARTRAQRFRAAYPDSAHLQQVEQRVGDR